MEIRFKKCGISSQPDVCIFDDPCFSKFGALRGSCPHPGRQFVGLLCVSLAAPDNRWHKCHLYVEQNITARSRCLNWHLPYFQQQMPTSFGSRGLILSMREHSQCCQKVRPLSPVCRTCAHQVSKRGRDAESDAVIRLEEIHTFFSNECSRCSSIRNLYQVLFIILLIAKGGRTRKAAAP